MTKSRDLIRNLSLAASWTVLVAAGPGQAAVTVFGGGAAASDCFTAAKFGGPSTQAIIDCTHAIQSTGISDYDLAGTYVNRGVIYMNQAAFLAAQHDFEQAIKLQPQMGEAIVNRGGALIAQKKYAAGIAEISRGLTFSPDEPEKAYFNRALAYESLDDLKSAYYDYSKASALKPTWDEPRSELARFTVSER